MDPKVDHFPQPQQELKDMESSSAHSDTDPKEAGQSLTDQEPFMESISPKKSLTEDPNTTAGQSADTENGLTAKQIMDIDSSHQNSTIEDSLLVTPDIKTAAEVAKLTDQAVKYHISIKFNDGDGEPQVGSIEKSAPSNITVGETDQTVKYHISIKLNDDGEPQVGSIEKSAPSNLTVGDTISDLLSTSNNRFHSSVGNSAAVSKEFLASTRLLGKFDEFINQAPLPRDETEREKEINKRIEEVSGLSMNEIEKMKKVMRVDRIRKKSEQDFSSISHRRRDESAMKSPPTECRSGWHRIMLARCKKRRNNFPQRFYSRTLKYSGDKASIDRSVRYKNVIGNDDLRPGESLVYNIRVYKPFNHLHPTKKGWVSAPISKFYRTGRGVNFHQDFQLLGSQTLCHLRDRIRCPNDMGPQQDLSQTPEKDGFIDLKKGFPSSFLFINNVFYNDMRHTNSLDISQPIREWAIREGLPSYEHRSMEGVTFDSISIRLGHPELFMHQGECEHLFTISKVKVLQPADICVSTMYPYSTALNPYYSVNCIICTKLGAKWIVTGCERIPFDPAFVCGICFKLYLYHKGKKVGNFKAYKYQIKNMQITDTF